MEMITEEVIVTKSVGAVSENVEVVPLETEAKDDPIIHTSAVSQAEISIQSNDTTEYVVDVCLTGKELATTKCVGENVDDVVVNTSAVSQTEISVESEDANESVGGGFGNELDTIESVEENVDGVFSQEDDEIQLSNEDEPTQVNHKLPPMKDNVDDILSLEDDEVESVSEAERLEIEATNVTAISTCVEDNFDETQTNTQPEKCVEHTKISIDQSKVTFPATFVSFEIDIQFGSFNRIDETNMFAINSCPTPDDVKSTLKVIDFETRKTVESEHSCDQVNENVLEGVAPITMTEETYELTKEEFETALKEKNRLDEEIKEYKAQERKKINALKAQKRAEKKAQQEAQEEAQQLEKRRLRRLKKREKKRASLERKRVLAAEDATNINVNDEIVAESNRSNEFENQPKLAMRNKNRWTHRGNMIITFVVLILWVFSFLQSSLQQKPTAGPRRKTYIF